MTAVGETRILDPEDIAAMGREMADMGQSIDRLGEDLPTNVAAGPLSESVVVGLVTMVRNAAELSARLQMTAEAVRQAASNYRDIEEKHQQNLKRYLQPTGDETRERFLGHDDRWLDPLGHGLREDPR
jgi:hypothetical protein